MKTTQFIYYNNSLKTCKMEGRREKLIFSGGGDQLEEVSTRKGVMNVYMVAIFCIHI
jgi:hypothetical protein